MNKTGFIKLLHDGEPSVPPLEINVLAGQGNRQAYIVINVAWRGRSCKYVAELKDNAKPLTLKLAIQQVKEYADKLKPYRPMIIAPYLTSEKLDQLLDKGISAIDFSGNAAVDMGNRFLFYKTGNPNRYPDSSSANSAYRGKMSLVARVLLLERRFKAVGDILKAIESRGGDLTMGTISKALKRLEADLAIERPNINTVRVIQPEALLKGLLDAYEPPNVESSWTGKVNMPIDELSVKLENLAGDNNLAQTGVSSAGEYAVWAGEPIIACYSKATPGKLLEQLGVEARETLAFANLRVIQTDDPRVYFDRRRKLIASPIQSWLEMASGDKRQKETAEQIRNFILDNTGSKA